ncbi:MAG: DHH family phosphoesterase [Coriobacteriia bacterium]
MDGRAEDILGRALGSDRVALLHHWDADGVCSAALAVRKMRAGGWRGEPTFVCPELGEYGVSEELAVRIADLAPGAVIVVDYNVSAGHQGLLAETTGAPVLILDHHRPRSPEAGKTRGTISVVNPAADGASEWEYPACTFVLETVLGAGPRWLVDVGIVGDLHHRAVDWFEQLEADGRGIRGAGYSFDDLFEASLLIDAHYKVNDRQGVETATEFMVRAEGLADVLGREDWRDVKSRVDREMERLLAVQPELRGKGAVFRLDTPMNLTSALTRRLARENPDRSVVVINASFLEDADQFYVRNVEPRVAATAIETALSKGYSAGGKDSVFAAVVPKEDSSAFLDEVLSLVDGA